MKNLKYLFIIGLLLPFCVYAKGYEIVSGDLDTVGSIVKIDSEEFYVIGKEDDTHIKLFAKYNLAIGSGFDTYTYRQSSLTEPQKDSNNDLYYNGVLKFSENEYWKDENGNILDKYNKSEGDFTYVYDENSNYYNHLNKYVEYLNSNGVCTTGRLIDYKDLHSLGCVDNCRSCLMSGMVYGCYYAPEWVTNTCYYTGDADYEQNHEVVGVFGGYSWTSNILYNTYYGLRPEIILNLNCPQKETNEEEQQTNEPINEVKEESNSEVIYENPPTGAFVSIIALIILIVSSILIIIYLKKKSVIKKI